MLGRFVFSFLMLVGAHANAAESAAPRIAKLKVVSLKPALTARNKLTLRGFTDQKPASGYQWTIEPKVRFPAEGEKKGVVQIKIVGTADASSPLVKGMPPTDFQVEHKIELKELEGKKGEFDVEVVDGAGESLFQTSIKT